jgi:hypothetical protein
MNVYLSEITKSPGCTALGRRLRAGLSLLCKLSSKTL